MKPEILILAALACVTVVCCVALVALGPSREPIKVIVELGGLTKTNQNK